MKLVIDEKSKHRLIGLAVVISLGAIFAPAMMKKSSQRLDGNVSVNVTLPPKPISPNIVITDEKGMFKTVKIAKAQVPVVSETRQVDELVKAEPLSTDLNNVLSKKVVAKVEKKVPSKSMQLALNDSGKAAPLAAKKAVAVALTQKTSSKVASEQSGKKDIYAVQLASFSQLTNAQTLVKRLRKQGYKANYTQSRNGAFYKVYVGYSPRKLEVIKLKNQLASAMQLKGFVVNTGVS